METLRWGLISALPWKWHVGIVEFSHEFYVRSEIDRVIYDVHMIQSQRLGLNKPSDK